MQAAGKETSATQNHGWFSSLLLWGGVAFFLYVLSTGPVARLCQSGSISPNAERVLEAIYAPLKVAADNVPVVQAFFEWYWVHVWGTTP